MSQLTKAQLEAENQSNFPNNNTGFITAERLRQFNTDMINSLVDEGSYNIDSASFSSSIDSLQAQVDGLVASGSGVVVQEEGSSLGTATTLNFVGDAVTASLAGGVATINVNAGAGNTSGTSGTSGVDGTSGINGTAGSGGTSGVDGTNGVNGTSGVDGSNGTSGVNGTSGIDGTAGSGGTSGTSGVSIDSASFATTGSNEFFGNQIVRGDVLVDGDLTARVLYIDSSSILYTSGSNKFGDSLDDTQELTGSVTITGSLTMLDGVANLTASWALNALTASYVDNAGTSSYAQYADNTIVFGKNVSGGTIEKGTPLYFTGSGASGNIVGVWPADAGNPNRMPAGGVAGEQMLDEAEGIVLIDGFINGVDTSLFNSGDEVFVAVGGGYTNVAPTGSANLIQKLGNVEKVDASNGSGVINGPGAARSVPNIQTGYLWVGNEDGVATPIASSSLFDANTSGTSGTSGVNGTSGIDGTNGTGGTSGIDGTNGTAGTSGIDGTNGTGGTSGTSGNTADAFPFTGSAEITGSLRVTGSIYSSNLSPSESIVFLASDNSLTASNDVRNNGTNFEVGNSFFVNKNTGLVTSNGLNTGATVSAGALRSSGNTGQSRITGSLGVSGSITITTGSFSGSVVDNIGDIYTSVDRIEHIVTLTQAEYDALGSVDGNTLYVISGSVVDEATGFPFTGSAQITGSLGVTGSISLSLDTYSGSVVDNITDTYTDVGRVNHVVTLTSASYAALGTKDPNTLYIVSGSTATTGSAGADGTSGTSGVDGTNGTAGTSGNTTILAIAKDGTEIADASVLNFTGSSVTVTDAGAGQVNVEISAGAGSGFPFVGKAEVTGSVDVSGSYFITSGSYTGSLVDNVSPSYGGVPEVKHVVAITSASYAALGTKDPNTLYVVSGSAITGSGGGTTSTFPYSGSAQITGSMGITGSLKGNHVNMAVASSTASMDVSAGNFFVLQLSSGNTHITAENVQGSQTTNLLLKSVSGASVTFGPNILQPSGSFFTASSATAQDVLTFIAFDTTSMYLVGLNNFQ